MTCTQTHSETCNKLTEEQLMQMNNKLLAQHSSKCTSLTMTQQTFNTRGAGSLSTPPQQELSLQLSNLYNCCIHKKTPSDLVTLSDQLDSEDPASIYEWHGAYCVEKWLLLWDGEIVKNG